MKNSTTKILTIAVVLLLLVNATMLYFMMKHRGGERKPERDEISVARLLIVERKKRTG